LERILRNETAPLLHMRSGNALALVRGQAAALAGTLGYFEPGETAPLLDHELQRTLCSTTVIRVGCSGAWATGSDALAVQTFNPGECWTASWSGERRGC